MAPPKTPMGRPWATPCASGNAPAVSVRWTGAHRQQSHRADAAPHRPWEKNWLFRGSDRGANWLAIHQTLLGSCALAGITDPWTYLRDVLTKLARGLAPVAPGRTGSTAWLAAQAPQAKPA